MTAAVTQVAMQVGVLAACLALGVARASYYRAIRPARAPDARRSHRALTMDQRDEVLGVLHAERFVDKAPAEVYATLLDEGRYVCSERTMYRVLEDNREVRERRDQLRHPAYAKPELLATRPNELWSWDITKLLGPEKWTYFYLYVVLDVFSRYVVGWMLAPNESATLATKLLEEICVRQKVDPGTLTVHADRGSSMRSKAVALLLSDLGVTKTHSRPHVSDDNPYSESQFKTMKYRPDFPERFGCMQDARAHCGPFFDWYNDEHHHAGIGLHTPRDVHYGLAQERRVERARTLDAAYVAHPERFVHGAPKPPALPTAVWINEPKKPVRNACSDLAPEHALEVSSCPPEPTDLEAPTHDVGSSAQPDTSATEMHGFASRPSAERARREGGAEGLFPQQPLDASKQAAEASRALRGGRRGSHVVASERPKSGEA